MGSADVWVGSDLEFIFVGVLIVIGAIPSSGFVMFSSHEYEGSRICLPLVFFLGLFSHLIPGGCIIILRYFVG